MIISTKDKIDLVEFLGYSVEKVEDKWFAKTAAFEFPIESFDPLDVVTLFKAVDIIEAKGHSSRLDHCTLGKYYVFTIHYTKSINGTTQERANTREEAILKAVLQYIKSLK